jgi:hypothetical protein
MYYKAPMHPEFGSGYKAGIIKGRSLERRVWFLFVSVWMLGWFLLNHMGAGGQDQSRNLIPPQIDLDSRSTLLHLLIQSKEESRHYCSWAAR